jgi:hypothetical protein
MGGAQREYLVMPEPVDGDLTLEEKKAFLRELKEAYFSGVTRVRFRERDVSYRSLPEMQKIIDTLEREITGNPSRPPPSSKPGHTGRCCCVLA